MSLFGTSTSQAGGLFGNSTAQTQPSGGGLFGGLGQNNQSQPQQTGSLFGSSTQQNQPQQNGGLFGSSTQQSQPQQTGGLFGQSTQQNQPQQTGGLFGQSIQQNQSQQTGGGLFGNLNKPQQPTGEYLSKLSSSNHKASAFLVPQCSKISNPMEACSASDKARIKGNSRVG